MHNATVVDIVSNLMQQVIMLKVQYAPTFSIQILACSMAVCYGFNVCSGTDSLSQLLAVTVCCISLLTGSFIILSDI